MSTAKPEPKIDLKEVNEELQAVNEQIKTHTNAHNQFLKDLGLPPV